MQKSVSIIITTKNEEKNIYNILTSLNHQTVTASEIIIVDNFSTDRTVEIIKSFDNVVLRQLGPERSAQRNLAMKIAKGKFILWLDADMIVSKNLIESCLSVCAEHKVKALYIPEIIIGKGIFQAARRFERCFYDGTVIDCVRFFETELANKIGGFDNERLSAAGPEDWDFDRRIREKINPKSLFKTFDVNYQSLWNLANFNKLNDYNLNNLIQADLPAIFHNEIQLDMVSYIFKKGKYNSGLEKYILKWGARDPEVRYQLGMLNRGLVVFFQKGLWKYTVVHWHLYLFTIAIRSITALNFKIKTRRFLSFS